MAVHSVPEEVGKQPRFCDFGSDYKKYTAATEAWVETVKAFAKTHGSGKLKGEEVRFQVADGYARYVVVSTSPTKLIHLPIYDAYQFPYAHRLTAADIREEIRRGKSLNALFGRE